MENTQLTSPGSNKTPEQIQDEMGQTREALTEKVAALEHQVVGTVQTAADTFTGAVESVKSMMTTAPGVVADTVKEAAAAVKRNLDLTSHVRDHPWSALGISAAVGFMAGRLLLGSRAVASVPAQMAHTVAAPTPVPARPGIFDDVVSVISRKLREVTETALDAATAAVNKNVRAEVPKLVDAATESAAARLHHQDPHLDRFHQLGGLSH